MLSNPITASELHGLLLAAAETDRRLPTAERRTPTSWWPELRQEWADYAPDRTQVRLARATPEQIDAYDLVHAIVAGIRSLADRRLLWAVAQSAVFRHRGPAWSRIARLTHTNRRAVKNAYELCLHRTAAEWNARQRNNAASKQLG